tara:strand:+ start:426 stop:1073 length:648 start_codon:yes stop_codon:yes gene_type:complete
MGFVYMLTSPSKKRYIGITSRKCVEYRWQEHFKASQKAEGGCPMIKRAIQKYGFDKIEKEILLEIDNEFLNEYEQKFIKQYNTLAPNGYNCTSGGDGGKLLCEETKEKIGKTAKQNCWNIAKGSIQPNKKGHFHLRYGRSKKTIGTYQTRELAEKAFIIWKETGTVSEEGRVKRGNGYVWKNGKRFSAQKNHKHLGTFDTREEAQKALDDYIKSL